VGHADWPSERDEAGAIHWDCELKSSYVEELETLIMGQKSHSAFLPAFFAAAQRAFAARDNFLFNAALIFRLGFRVLIPEEADCR
jgi:hypothetical protein